MRENVMRGLRTEKNLKSSRGKGNFFVLIPYSEIDISDFKSLLSLSLSLSLAVSVSVCVFVSNAAILDDRVSFWSMVEAGSESTV